MRTIVAFARLSRLKFLFGGFAGFALGATIAAAAGATLAVPAYCAGQALVTAFHLMTHYANDYFDRHADVHTRPTAFAGGSGVLVAGLLAPRVALVAALSCALAGLAFTAGFALTGNPVVASLGIGIGGLAWIYSAPPLRLAERGWGELDTAAVVAVLVPLTGFATFAGTIDARIAGATVGPACAMFAMMIAVEWPDRLADLAAGKRNLVVRLGADRAGRLAALAALAVVPATIAPVAFGAPRSLVLFGLLLLGPALTFARRVGRPETDAAEIAARGVTLFCLTLVLGLFGYACVLR
jgi:1,4-dihydroxy-2-naphthoate octaprenyltransferase